MLKVARPMRAMAWAVSLLKMPVMVPVWSMLKSTRVPVTGAGEADVGGGDPQVVHQVEDADLLLDRRVFHRGRLDAVAERLVVELEGAGKHGAAALGFVPVVDQPVLHRAHGSGRRAGRSTELPHAQRVKVRESTTVFGRDAPNDADRARNVATGSPSTTWDPARTLRR